MPLSTRNDMHLQLRRQFDQVALLIEIGLHDLNPKLRGQLIDELRQHQSDERARVVLEISKT